MITLLALIAALWILAGVVVLVSTVSPSRQADLALANRTPVTLSKDSVLDVTEASLAA